MSRKLLFVAVLMILATTIAKADSTDGITLLLFPHANITAAPGSTTSWGFEVKDTGPYYIELDSSQFCSGSCSGISAFGTYVNTISPLATIFVGPADVHDIAFDLGVTSPFGIGNYTLNPDAVGTISGNILINYTLYSADPNDFVGFRLGIPASDIFSTGNQVSLAASVTSTGKAVATPEPAVGLLLFAAGALALFAKNVAQR
jgi:hypothetical protein